MINISQSDQSILSYTELDKLDVKLNELCKRVKEVALKNGFSKDLKNKIRIELQTEEH